MAKNSVRTKEFNKEVLYICDSIVKVDYQDILKLKNQSDKNKRKRIRLCSHRDIEEKIHEMLIVHAKNTYVRPHKHLSKIESFHVIEGTADVVIYNDDGLVRDIIPMGKYGTDRIFYYRLSDALYHNLRITSDHFVFHEITNGPFDKSDTEWASWAPDENEPDAVNKFMNRMKQFIESFNSK